MEDSVYPKESLHMARYPTGTMIWLLVEVSAYVLACGCPSRVDEQSLVSYRMRVRMHRDRSEHPYAVPSPIEADSDDGDRLDACMIARHTGTYNTYLHR